MKKRYWWVVRTGDEYEQKQLVVEGESVEDCHKEFERQTNVSAKMCWIEDVIPTPPRQAKKIQEDGLIIFPCQLEDESEAELHIHATDEGLVFDVWQKDECVRTGYMFVEDIVAHTQ